MAKEKNVAYIGKVIYTRTDSQYPDFDIEVTKGLKGDRYTKCVITDKEHRITGKQCSIGDYVHVCGTEINDEITPLFCKVISRKGK